MKSHEKYLAEIENQKARLLEQDSSDRKLYEKQKKQLDSEKQRVTMDITPPETQAMVINFINHGTLPRGSSLSMLNNNLVLEIRQLRTMVVIEEQLVRKINDGVATIELCEQLKSLLTDIRAFHQNSENVAISKGSKNIAHNLSRERSQLIARMDHAKGEAHASNNQALISLTHNMAKEYSLNKPKFSSKIAMHRVELDSDALTTIVPIRRVGKQSSG